MWQEHRKVKKNYNKQKKGSRKSLLKALRVLQRKAGEFKDHNWRNPGSC